MPVNTDEAMQESHYFTGNKGTKVQETQSAYRIRFCGLTELCLPRRLLLTPLGYKLLKDGLLGAKKKMEMKPADVVSGKKTLRMGRRSRSS